MVNNNTPQDDPNLIELIEKSDIVENYETKNFSIGTPSLKDVIELWMFERKLNKRIWL